MLGTVQFGLDYGISNSIGKTLPAEIENILATSQKAGISFLDTAFNYGESEKVLGQFKTKLQDFSVVTKLPYLDKSKLSLSGSFESSLNLLGLNSVYGLLFHDPVDILGPNGKEYFNQVVQLKEQGKVRKIGVSVYTIEQLIEVTKKYSIDLVQLPVNIFDQRFLENGLLSHLKKKGIEIHVRSVFLQGLLLMNPSELNPFFDSIKTHATAFHSEIANRNYSRQEVCLSFVRDIAEVDRIVVGVNNAQQLEQLVSMYSNQVEFDYSAYKLDDESILLPSNWKVV